MFEKWARETPHRPAVVTRGDRVTYGTLDVRANRLARHLLHRGLGPGDTVAVCLSRLPDLLIAVVGVLKAGGAFAMVDPHQPTGEIGRWLERAEAGTVLTYEQFRPGVDDGTGRRVVCLDADADLIDAHSPEPPSAPCGPTAAVLFTAGTTGRARPVDTAHRRLRAAYGSWAEVFGLRPSDVHLVTAPTDTAAFAYGWIRALCSGGTLVLPEGEIGPTLWGQSFAEGVTVLDTDPLTARLLLDGSAPPAGLRLVTVGGERLFLDEQSRLQERMAPGGRLLNVYGPVEVAGCGTWSETDRLSGAVAGAGRVSLLGRPFPGCRVEVRKGQIWLTPPGGVAGGDALPTGDAGTLGEDGLLRFAGRLAHRVTLRGRTVDPYPAEAALATHPGIREAAISVVDDDQLVAYVVPGTATAAPGAETVRTHLTGVVPDSEIPVSVVNMGALPRNRAGKVDRRLLPLPARRGAYGGKGGKGRGEPGHPEAALRVTGCAMLVMGLPLAALFTDVFWPGSTDLTLVPTPWSWLFRGLYLAELLAFCLGLAFLFTGRSLMRRQGRSAGLTTAAHLAVVWLLVSWWPQDNFYRLAAKNDWERQAALVYTFNVPLMIAAAVVAVFVTRSPAPADTE
ncbi:hypothetical protein SGFS_091100 [Streptomyces graminofaciens]|uniref:Uncharacterized protein n=1 Tax=Streptomyces graminofaciens TaxID=68212 RepID=A0ABN5W0C4_9ACTN|nr:hypothetical protein SGFS_091100 [Streptomyces graminofaciens]